MLLETFSGYETQQPVLCDALNPATSAHLFMNLLKILKGFPTIISESFAVRYVTMSEGSLPHFDSHHLGGHRDLNPGPSGYETIGLYVSVACEEVIP